MKELADKDCLIITLEDQLQEKSSALEKACKSVQYFMANQKVLEKELMQLRSKLEVSRKMSYYLRKKLYFIFIFQGSADGVSTDAVSHYSTLHFSFTTYLPIKSHFTLVLLNFVRFSTVKNAG